MPNDNKKLELKLENIGLIKEANIDISGLTVIAGKNDQGKSTVGKALMALIKANNKSLEDFDNIESAQNKAQSLENLAKNNFNSFAKQIFDSKISSDGKIVFRVDNEDRNTVSIKSNRCVNFKTKSQIYKDRELIDCTIIYTPIVWDLHEFFYTLLMNEKEDSMINKTHNNIDFPYLLWDLHKKMLKEVPRLYLDEQVVEKIQTNLEQIIGGSFGKEDREPYYFLQNSNRRKKIPLRNTAIGIKNFGIIQILLEKNRFTPQGYFIFDEPENHLHPTWQIEFAKVLVALVNNGIRIMINTHSPYMLEGLRTYSKEISDKIKFYLADDRTIKQINGNNDETLDEIFDKLHQAYTTLDEIEGS